MHASVLGIVNGKQRLLRLLQLIVHDDILIVHPLRQLAGRVTDALLDDLGRVGGARFEPRTQRVE